MKFIFPFIFSLLFATGLTAQNNNNVRYLNPEEVLKVNQQSTAPAIQSLKIQDGGVWLNGNPVAKDKLPDGLKNLPPDYRMQLSFQGGDEIEVNLFGQDYLIRNGQIAQLKPQVVAPPAELNTSNTNSAQSEYLNTLNENSPVLFQRLSKEAGLYEQAMRLAIDYETADEDAKHNIREEMRRVLGKLFDLNMENMDLEVKQLEEELNIIKADIEYRRKNKTSIIESRLNELTGGK